MVSSISKKPFRFLQIFLKEIIIEFPLWFLRIFPTEIGVILRSICYSVLLKKQKKFLRIAENVTVKGFKNIELGERVTLNQFSYIHAVNGFLKVGDRFVGNYLQLLAGEGEIIIGNDVMVGPHTIIRAANHNLKRIDIPMLQQGHTWGSIVIEDDVWIAAKAVILSNVTIGKGSVVAAGAIVTKDVPPFSVVGGIPAKIIQSRGEKE